MWQKIETSDPKYNLYAVQNAWKDHKYPNVIKLDIKINKAFSMKNSTLLTFYIKNIQLSYINSEVCELIFYRLIQGVHNNLEYILKQINCFK